MVAKEIGANANRRQRVVGARHAFYSNTLVGGWRETIAKTAIKPPKSGHMATQCDNTRCIQSQAKGHTAMLYYDGSWDLVVIKKLLDRGLTVQKLVESNGNLRLSNPQFLGNEQLRNESIFYFVNVYSHDDCSKSLSQYPATLPPSGHIQGASTPSLYKDLQRSKPPKELGNPHTMEETPKEPKGGLQESKEGLERSKESKSHTNPRDLFGCQTLQSQWTTIYVPSNLESPIQDNLSGHSKCVFVPSPSSPEPVQGITKESHFQKWRYYKILASDLGSIDPLGVTSPQEELAKLNKGWVDLLRVTHSDTAVRFVVTDKMDEVQAGHSSQIDGYPYKLDIPNKDNLGLGGAVVSMWTKQDEDDPTFSFGGVQAMQDAIGKGFGPRDRSSPIGTNAYFGPRQSSRPHASPFALDEDHIYFGEYHRADWHHTEDLFRIKRKLLRASQAVPRIANNINSGYINFIGSETCSLRTIWTSGTTRRTSKKRDMSGGVVLSEHKVRGTTDCVGFANMPHEDLCDLLPEEVIKYFFLSIKKSRRKNKSAARRRYIKNIEKIQKLVHLGLPTTCGYNVLFGDGVTSVDQRVSARECTNASFAMFHFAMPIEHKTVHHFCGWSFHHMTTLPGDHERSL